MISVLVDTDVFPYAFLKGCDRDQAAANYRRLIDGLDCEYFCLSRQTYAEFLAIPVVRGWSERRISALHQLFHKFVVIDTNQNIAHKYADLYHEARLIGRPMQSSDLWNLATAGHGGLALLTNDRDFFWKHGVDIITLNEDFTHEVSKP